MEDWKKNLKEFAKKKRGTLLKDCTVVDINVACDHAVDAGLDLTEPVAKECFHWRNMVYLRFASPEQAEALKKRIAHRRAELDIPRKKTRPIVVFHGKALVHVLQFLTGHNCSKYYRHADWRKIATVD